MKTKLFLSTLLLTVSVAAFAQTSDPHTYDFAVPNNKGDTIWYLITSPQTVAVSFRCDSVRDVIKSDHYLSWGNLPRRNLYQGNIVVPSKVTWQSVEYRVTAVAASAFLNTSLESVTLPVGIDSIGDYNFSECSRLKKLSLPDSVCYIGIHCFQFLDLEEVHFGDLVSHLGEHAFLCSGIRRFVCPPLITKIEYICYSCQNLSEVILPEGLDTIHLGFDNTPSLKYIHFPNSLKYVYGFVLNSGLREVVFPASVGTVRGFSGCPDLHSVEFLGGTEYIDGFGEDDTSLLFLDLSPTRMRVWRHLSFYYEKMRGLILPQSLKKIENAAIYKSFGVTYLSLVLPEKVDSIHAHSWTSVFNDNARVKGKLVLKPVEPPTVYGFQIELIKWMTPYSNLQVYVPCGSLEAYKNDPWWHYLYPNIREMDMVEVVIDSLCEHQIQEQYGFMASQPGVYTVDKPAADSLDCDTLFIYYVRNVPKSKVVDTSIHVYDDGTAFEWTWEGNGEEYDVFRDNDFLASVKEAFYRDTAVETGVQYCYNFIPYLKGCQGEISITNCYTRVPDSTGVDSTGVDSTGVDSTGVAAIRKHVLTLRPNPAMETLFITSGGAASEAGSSERYDNMSYEIIDAIGRIVLQGRYNDSEGIRVGGLAKGIYLLRMEGKVGKFVKE